MSYLITPVLYTWTPGLEANVPTYQKMFAVIWNWKRKLRAKVKIREKSTVYVTLFSTKRRKRELEIKTSIDPQSKPIEIWASWSITCHPIIEITIICVLRGFCNRNPYVKSIRVSFIWHYRSRLQYQPYYYCIRSSKNHVFLWIDLCVRL